jgi:hypothetical protein
MITNNRTQDNITFSGHHKPVLLALEYIGGGEYALRYSCRDSDLWNRIKDEIMSFDRSERRYDLDEFNGKGAWVVDETVLNELTKYFPSIPAWLKKTSQPMTPVPSAVTANIEDCSF